MWGNYFQQSVKGAEMFWTHGKDNFLTFDQFCRVPATQFFDILLCFGVTNILRHEGAGAKKFRHIIGGRGFIFRINP